MTDQKTCCLALALIIACTQSGQAVADATYCQRLSSHLTEEQIRHVYFRCGFWRGYEQGLQAACTGSGGGSCPSRFDTIGTFESAPQDGEPPGSRGYIVNPEMAADIVPNFEFRADSIMRIEDLVASHSRERVILDLERSMIPLSSQYFYAPDIEATFARDLLLQEELQFYAPRQ